MRADKTGFPIRCAGMDVGSNALRLAIAEFKSPTRYKILERKRVSVRLGQSVFRTSRIDPDTLDKALAAFHEFRALMEQYDVVLHRAVATSATREAKNRAAFLERVHTETGIDLELIEGTEEARLVALGVREKVALRGTSLIVDVGGGSAELALLQRGQILLVESHNLGTVRLLEQVGNATGHKFLRLLRDTLRASRFPMLESLRRHRVSQIVGTGGNIEAIATLPSGTGRSAAQKGDTERAVAVPLAKLRTLLEKLVAMTPEERAKKYDLKPDRADVIVPAGAIFEHIAARTKARQIMVPFVGLVDGVLLDLARLAGAEGQKELETSQTLNAAQAVMKKYDPDPKHSRHVASLALSIFDQLKDVHKLGKRERLLLQIAALLHEVGNFISGPGHHRHAHYIISETPILGLNDEEVQVVANVARYHRKAPPDLSHESYAALSEGARDQVRALAAILRLADALDHDHRQHVLGVSAKAKESQLTLKARTRGDVTLDEWSVGEKGGDLFTE